MFKNDVNPQNKNPHSLSLFSHSLSLFSHSLSLLTLSHSFLTLSSFCSHSLSLFSLSLSHSFLTLSHSFLTLSHSFLTLFSPLLTLLRGRSRTECALCCISTVSCHKLLCVAPGYLSVVFWNLSCGFLHLIINDGNLEMKMAESSFQNCKSAFSSAVVHPLLLHPCRGPSEL